MSYQVDVKYMFPRKHTFLLYLCDKVDQNGGLLRVPNGKKKYKVLTI